MTMCNYWSWVTFSGDGTFVLREECVTRGTSFRWTVQLYTYGSVFNGGRHLRDADDVGVSRASKLVERGRQLLIGSQLAAEPSRQVLRRQLDTQLDESTPSSNRRCVGNVVAVQLTHVLLSLRTHPST